MFAAIDAAKSKVHELVDEYGLFNTLYAAFHAAYGGLRKLHCSSLVTFDPPLLQGLQQLLVLALAASEPVRHLAREKLRSRCEMAWLPEVLLISYKSSQKQDIATARRYLGAWKEKRDE